MLDQKTLQTEAEIKAFLHPQRMDILRLLARKEASLSEIASELGVSPGSLSHHIKALIENQLIELSRTEVRGRQLCKYYRPTARTFHVESGADSENEGDKVLGFLQSDLEIARQGLTEDSVVYGLIKIARLGRSDLITFTKKMRDLIDEFSDCDQEGGTRVALNLSMYEQNRDYGPTGSINFSKKTEKKQRKKGRK